MFRSFKISLLGVAGLLAFHHPAPAQTPTSYLFPVVECIEPPQDLTNTPMAGFTDNILHVPRVYFSTYSSHSTTQTILAGTVNNFVSPGQTDIGQIQKFISGYDRASFGMSPDNDSWNQTSFPGFTWFLNGAGASVPPPTSASLRTYSADYAVPFAATFGVAYCPATLIPAVPVLFRGTTALNQKIASLLTPAPPGVSVTVEALPLTSDVTLQNVTYFGGAIYADITSGSGNTTAASKVNLRVKAANTVIAFGSMPVLETIGCSSSLTGSIPDGSIGSDYSAVLSVTPAGTYTMALQGALPPGLSFSNGTISGTPLYPGSYPFSVAAAGCSSDVTSQVSFAFSGLTHNLATGQWTETVTLQNRGGTPLAGPVALVLSTLSSNATLGNGQGFTSCSAPSGQPYVTIPGGLNAGQSEPLMLTFTNSQASQGITFTPRVLAGGSTF